MSQSRAAVGTIKAMDDRRIGRILRAVRQRRGLRQSDVAATIGVGQTMISRLERGRLESVGLATLRRVAMELDVSITISANWRGGQGDRLLDRAHAAIVDHVIKDADGARVGDRARVQLQSLWRPRIRGCARLAPRPPDPAHHRGQGHADGSAGLACLAVTEASRRSRHRQREPWLGRRSRGENRGRCRHRGEPIHRRPTCRHLRCLLSSTLPRGEHLAAPTVWGARRGLVRLYQFPGDWYVGGPNSNPSHVASSCMTLVRCSHPRHQTNAAPTVRWLRVAW
jgi:transcriptional regulator with XRE-family HTH domain